MESWQFEHEFWLHHYFQKFATGKPEEDTFDDEEVGEDLLERLRAGEEVDLENYTGGFETVIDEQEKVE